MCFCTLLLPEGSMMILLFHFLLLDGFFFFFSWLGWGVDVFLDLLDDGADILDRHVKAVELLGVQVDHVGGHVLDGLAPCSTCSIEIFLRLVGVVGGCGGLEGGGELLELLPCLLTFFVESLKMIFFMLFGF